MKGKIVEESGIIREEYNYHLGKPLKFNIRDIRKEPYRKPIDDLSCIIIWDGNDAGAGSISLSFTEFEALISTYEAFCDKSLNKNWED